MARRLVRVFLLLVIVPVVSTALTQASLGRRITVGMVDDSEQINRQAVQESARTFQELGRQAIQQTGTQTRQIAVRSLESATRQTAQTQAHALNAASQDLIQLTRRSFDDSMRQSLQTHHTTLQNVQAEMARLFAQSAQNTQQQATARTESAMLALVNTLMQERADRLAMQINEHINDATNFLVLTAQTPDLQDGRVAGQKATLDALVRRFPQFQRLAVLDKAGRETALSDSDRAAVSGDLGVYPDADYFRAALAGKSYIGTDSGRSAAGAPILWLAVPIEAYRGHVVGVLAARLSLDELWEAIRAERIGKAGFAYVLDASGQPLLPTRASSAALMTGASQVETLRWRVVAAVPRREAFAPVEALKQTIAQNHRRAQNAMRQNMARTARTASLRLSFVGVKLRDANSRKMQFTARQVVRRLHASTARQAQSALHSMETSLTRQGEAMQQASETEITRAGNDAPKMLIARLHQMTMKAMRDMDGKMSLTMLPAVVTFCFLGYLLALFTARRIVRPIIQLVSMAQAIAGGDLTRRVNVDAPDEVGDLAAAFNAMAVSLQRSRSELNEAESQLVQSAKLASLGTLSAGVAHELNQPVAIIRGLAQQLQGEPELNADCLEDLKLIEGQTTRMTKIIKHLRTFCRTGGAELARVPVDQVAQDCIILIGEQLRAHDVSLRFDLHGIVGNGSPACVLGDANELEQVFINLITNARDAMEGRADAQITVASRCEAGQYVIAFRDNGTGVPESVVAHIFDPFFTTKEPGKGTGLGLSISHTILKKHGGDIRVHNDGGAVFTITLPLAPAVGGENELHSIPGGANGPEPEMSHLKAA